LRLSADLRQIEAAELMISGKNYTVSFAAAIFGVTSQEQLVKPEKDVAKSKGSNSRLLLEETTESLIGDLAVVRRTYGQDVLALTVICRCLDNLIQNAAVAKYLQQNHPGVRGELQNVISQVNAGSALTQ
jgi:hypothetical protein